MGPRAHLIFTRAISSLPNNPHIKVFDDHTSPASHILTLLDNDPPSKKFSIGTSAVIPPTPQSFRQNPEFLKILDQVIQEYGHEDEDVVSQARALAGPGGFNLGSGGAFFPSRSAAKRKVLLEGMALEEQAPRVVPGVQAEVDGCT
uniref:Uncharacterized protein n=1 Tax=Bionectria ochroleuca TaxID=29856 RepID=A0A8H7K7B3_BIOOC